MIHAVIELGERRVHEVMVPRIDIVGIEADADLETAVERIVASLPLFALGADVKTMTEFRSSLIGEREFWSYFIDEAIAANDFSYGFEGISPPSWEKVHLPGFREENNIRFTIRLDIKQQEDPAAAAGQKTA